MDYLPAGALEAALPRDTAAAATPAQIEAARVRVNSDLDQALEQAGYTLPITGGVTDAITGQLLDLAAYRLTLQLQLLPEPADKSGLYLAYRAAQAWLDGVRSGRVALALSDSSGGTPGALDTPEIATLPRRYWELS